MVNKNSKKIIAVVKPYFKFWENLVIWGIDTGLYCNSNIYVILFYVNKIALSYHKLIKDWWNYQLKFNKMNLIKLQK